MASRIAATAKNPPAAPIKLPIEAARRGDDRAPRDALKIAHQQTWHDDEGQEDEEYEQERERLLRIEHHFVRPDLYIEKCSKTEDEGLEDDDGCDGRDRRT